MAVKARKSMSLLRRFIVRRDGATAVEFALIAAPFLALMFGILELGMVFMVSTTLDNATDTAARQIRTGQVQTGGGTVATFKSTICDHMAWLGSSCDANLYLQVQTFPKFADVAVTDPSTQAALDDMKTDPSKYFVPGGPEDIVVVRAYYEWDLITPLLNDGLGNLPGGKRLIMSTATFRNEPYES
jgi:Flp pilus assembly protein TadG